MPQQLSWFLSPSSYELNSSWKRRCLEVAVRCTNCSLSLSYGFVVGGDTMRSCTSWANSDNSEATIWSNLVFWAVIPWVLNWALTCANQSYQTCRSADQNGGMFRLTVAVIGWASPSSDIVFYWVFWVTNIVQMVRSEVIINEDTKTEAWANWMMINFR